MNRFLQDALVALGWTEARQQNAFFSLLKRVVGQDAESVVFLSASDALEWVKHKTQESFLRAAGSERDACLYVGADAERIARENRGDLLALELIHSLFPPAQYYDAVLLMGLVKRLLRNV